MLISWLLVVKRHVVHVYCSSSKIAKVSKKQLERLNCFLFDTKQCIGSLTPIYATKEVEILMNSFCESIQ